MASISGPLFPALASESHGCLRVALQGDRLIAEGPVASSPFASMQAGQAQGQTNSVRFDPVSADLELSSVDLQPLLTVQQSTDRITTQQPLPTSAGVA